MASKQAALNFDLHPRQAEVLTSKAREILYGGAASGGKSHLARVLAILWAVEIPGLQIYFFRRLYDDLIKNHVEGPTGFRMMLAEWCNTSHPKSPLNGHKLCEVVEGEIRFWNGSKIFLCHCQHEKDLAKYRGPEFHVLFVEEATQFSEQMLRFLRSRCRIPDALKFPKKYEGQFPKVIYTSNPGGVGHQYIKEGFISAWSPLEYHFAPEDDGGYLRQFIPARVSDNPSVNIKDVTAGLKGLPPALQKQMLDGDWESVVGAYFPELRRHIHGIKPFPIPDHWPRFLSMDWGSCGEADPFSIGWWTVADGSSPQLPKGTLIRYREWYGGGLPKVTFKIVADGIKDRERTEKIAYRVAGKDCFIQDGGPSIAEAFAGYGLIFRPADNKRLPGWEQMRHRMVGVDGVPLVRVFDTCFKSLDIIPSLQHDQHDPNDLQEDNDHIAEEWRYAHMSRPWARAQASGPTPISTAVPTFDQAMKSYKKVVSRY